MERSWKRSAVIAHTLKLTFTLGRNELPCKGEFEAGLFESCEGEGKVTREKNYECVER